MIPTAPSVRCLVVSLALGTAGCAKEPLAPPTLEGTFELRSIGGLPLPAVFDSSPYGFSAAAQGSFTFASDGRVVWAWVQNDVRRTSLEEPLRAAHYSYETTLPYTLRGVAITIGAECPADAVTNCAAPMMGHIAGDHLSPTFSRAAWTFVRVEK